MHTLGCAVCFAVKVDVPLATRYTIPDRIGLTLTAAISLDDDVAII